MVTVVLDRAAAEGLPEDVKEYFTARFANLKVRSEL